MLRPDLVQALRRRRPLLHCVSNQVSANDCANLALAVGASPRSAMVLLVPGRMIMSGS